MLSDQLMKMVQFVSQGNISNFDHFDYANAYQLIKTQNLSCLQSAPKKKQIIQQFIDKAFQKIEKDNPVVKQTKVNNFLQRMQLNKRIHIQKMQALTFINQNYDSKSDQLLFYPKTTRKGNDKFKINQQKLQSQFSSASRNYSWDVQNDKEPSRITYSNGKTNNYYKKTNWKQRSQQKSNLHQFCIDQIEVIQPQTPILQPNLSEESIQYKKCSKNPE